jgi:hypothetical protein
MDPDNSASVDPARGKLLLRKFVGGVAFLIACVLYIAGFFMMLYAAGFKYGLTGWDSVALAAAVLVLGSAAALAAFLIWPHRGSKSQFPPT